MDASSRSLPVTVVFLNVWTAVLAAPAHLPAADDEGDASGVAEGNAFARVREQLNLPTSR